MSPETETMLPNLVTIVGRGVPSNYEITVNGSIELVGADPLEEATIVSDHAAEGAIETGMKRFRFSGQMANVHVVDWDGVATLESPSTPGVHIDYDVAAPNDET